MSCSQLSALRTMLNNDQYQTIEAYICSLSPNTKLTASKVAASCGFDIQLVQRILKCLVDEHVFKFSFVIRCPECGLLLSSVDDISDINKVQYCYNCEETFTISSDDVEVIYNFDNYPFVEGQQNKLNIEFDESAALEQDSLTQLLKDSALDLNALFFSPTDEEYSDLQILFNKIFEPQKNTKAVGDKLEDLTIKLFSLCKHFNAMPIRLKPNQIDCYVRNKLYIPGISQVGCIDSFEIECKNETKTPKSSYLNKLHSILQLSGKSFGIIISKCPAPKTFTSLANQVYLKWNIIIISLDKSDLQGIIFDKKNLLECIERKIEEVKLNATKDLRSIGLYNA